MRKPRSEPVTVVVARRPGRGAVSLTPCRRIEVLRNDAPEPGIASSLQVALRALDTARRTSTRSSSVSPTSRSSAPAAYRRVAAAYDDGARLAVAHVRRRSGAIPVLLARQHWPEALELDRRRRGAGAPAPLRRRPRCRATDTGDPTDVDTPQISPRWRNDGDQRQLPSEPPDRGHLEGAARHRAHRAVPARRGAARGRGRRLPRRREGQGRSDHRAVQGHGQARRGRRGGAPASCSTRPAATRVGRATPRRRSS